MPISFISDLLKLKLNCILIMYGITTLYELNIDWRERMIHVVDAPTGQGKTNAAINYINSHEGRYLFVTPYLTELERIKKACADKKFYEPKAIYVEDTQVSTKKNGIKKLFSEGKNIVTTHALFQLFDKEMIKFCKQYGYILILDEVTNVAEPYEELMPDDLQIMLEEFVYVEDHLLRWREDQEKYEGEKFLKEKGLCEMGCLYLYGKTTMLWQFSVDIFSAFKESFLLTYMFNGQIQKYYYDYHKLEYDRWYVKGDSIDTYELTSERQDYGKPSKYKELITIVDNKKMNAIGDDYYALSSNWYAKGTFHQKDMIRKKLVNFYTHYAHGGAKANLWTCFKGDQKVLRGNGYSKSFLSCNAKATNLYRDRTNLAYVINAFINPNIQVFFEDSSIPVDGDMYALSSLIQWVWRSAIRDGKPIILYVPSSRMRGLLIKWLNDEVNLEWG